MLKCDPDEAGSCDSGCNGGLMNSAFEYILKSGGIMREQDYPYSGTDRRTCKFDRTKIAASVANFSVVSLDEDHNAANLVKNGPLAVAINTVYMQTYIGGVCSRRLDHGVLLVGYGSDAYAPIRLKEKPYWIIKNSWGESWGENGYYKICRGRNVCGVDSKWFQLFDIIHSIFTICIFLLNMNRCPHFKAAPILQNSFYTLFVKHE
ncbi:hypothetical protein RJT34_31865 [Clitoria ternatea]|uniref:Peptidase C1A papain C-terminal domain-containing protein n=1 Tax=Clitoria ternatea TaxID=43366 RepID=A0AAN9EWB0_CLITE